jgi:hypothetical protein
MSDHVNVLAASPCDGCAIGSDRPPLTGTLRYAILQATPSHPEGIGSLRLIGFVFQLAYRLRRHLLFGWSLARWVGFLLVVGGLVAYLGGSGSLWTPALFGSLLVGYSLLLAWAARRRYVLFKGTLQFETTCCGLDSDPPLRAEELVPVRASGRFTVEGKDRYYMDLEADFETVGSREHIVLARVVPSRFLLFGNLPSDEWGWWYIFFQPRMIRRLVVGTLYFGTRSRQAVCVTYSPDGETLETVLLSFDDADAMCRVWHDLLGDAPPDLGEALRRRAAPAQPVAGKGNPSTAI